MSEKGEDEHLSVAFTRLLFESCQKEKRECALVVGPVWQPVNIMTGSDFEEQRVKLFIESFCKVMGDKANSNKTDLIRLESNSFPILSRDLKQRLETVLTGLQQVLAMSLPAGCILHRCDHVKLAEWSLFALHRKKWLPEKSLDQLEHSEIMGYRLVHPQPSREQSTLL